jgi:hypothetical protein
MMQSGSICGGGTQYLTAAGVAGAATAATAATFSCSQNTQKNLLKKKNPFAAPASGRGGGDELASRQSVS